MTLFWNAAQHAPPRPARRRLFAALLAAILAASAGPLARAQMAGPTITVGATVPDQAAGVVTLDNVAIVYPGEGGTRIAIDKVALRGMAAGADAFAAEEITLTGLTTTYHSGAAITVTVPAATLRNVAAPLPSTDRLGAVAAPGTMPPLAEWLLLARAASIDIPEVRLRTTVSGIVTDARYGKIRIEQLDRGRMALIGMDGATQDSTGGPPDQPTKAVFGPLRIEDVNLGAYAAWLDDSLAAAAPQDKLLLYKSFSLDGVELSGGTGGLTIGRLAGTDVKLGPPTMKPSELMAMIGKMQADPKFGEKSPREMTAFLRAVFGAFEMGSFEMADLKASEGAKAPVTIGLFRLERFAGTRIGEIRLGDLAFVDPDNGAAVKLGSFAIRGISVADLEPLLEGLANGQEPGTLPPSQLPKPRIDGIALADLAVTIPDQGAFAVRGFSIDTPAWIGFSPVTLKSYVEGFSMPVAAITDPVARAKLGALGVETLIVDSALDLSWVEPEEVLTLGPVSLTVEGIGKASVRAVAGGVPKSVIENPQTAEQAIATLDFRALSVVLEDGGAFDKLLDGVAADQGMSRQQLAQQVSQQVQGLMIALLGMEDAGKSLGTALKTFISDPRSLTLAIGASEPVPAIAFINISNGDQDALNVIKRSITIEATANQ
jgi:hypothetical protein